MTGYHMTLGYTANTEGGEAGLEKNWRTFKRVVAKLREQPRLILDEVMRVEKKHWTATEWAEAYSVKAGQEIIHIAEDRHEIWLAAAGSEQIKFRFRRAFCRLVMAEMNRRDIEINLIVA